MTAHTPSLTPAATAKPTGEAQYLALLAEIMAVGAARADRTGVGTQGVFGPQSQFDPGARVPLLTTKKGHFPPV
ncbi:MAG: thymidylate synthase, partial [Caulobacteraceae bacterium]